MQISREQGHCIKGLAILLIMLHNFVDQVINVECNEMVFTQENLNVFLSNVFSTSFFWYIISYAGWIGVPLFFFMSGYGLTKKYDINQAELHPAAYLKNHIIKLWKLLVPVYVLNFLIYHYWFHQTHNIKSFLAQITFTINFLSYNNNDFILNPGVYWFFGAILQFYCLFLVFRKMNNKWLWVTAVGFLLVHYAILYFVPDATMKLFRHNFLGWGVPFILGMLAARAKRDVAISEWWRFAIGVAAFIALGFCLITKCLAPFVEISVIIVFISFLNLYNVRWIRFLGIISASIFVIHPFVRTIIMNTFCSSHYPLAMTIIYLIPVLVLSWLHHCLLNKSFKIKGLNSGKVK